VSINILRKYTKTNEMPSLEDTYQIYVQLYSTKPGVVAGRSQNHPRSGQGQRSPRPNHGLR
jgi:hypothetical protein